MTRRSWSAARNHRLPTHGKKGSPLASLFLFAFSNWSFAATPEDVIQQAFTRNLHEDLTWHALIHSSDDKPSIRGSSFLLSRDKFSPKNELVETIRVLYAGDSGSGEKCRYPARNKWIAEKLALRPVSLQHCSELQEFIARAPADEIVLVYASENISQPSSMMGHILLKMAGEDAQGHRREHAVSFFTEIEGINFPKIVYDSLITGKKGYFALSPYENRLEAYLAAEQRNVWEYRLSLTETQREMVQLHIWELKTADPTYYFDAYNCATLTNYVLATANPDLLDAGSYLLSPLDVVKNAYRHGMFGSVSVLPSSKWKIRMIAESLPTSVNRRVKKAVDTADARSLPSMPSAEKQFLVESLASTYNDYLYETSRRSASDWSGYEERLRNQESPDHDRYAIELSQYKNPLKTPKDGQWYAGFNRLEDQNYLKLGVLPISHTLSDDNSQYFSETELRLADVSILVSTDGGDIELPLV